MKYRLKVTRAVTIHECALIDVEAESEGLAKQRAAVIARKDEYGPDWIFKGGKRLRVAKIETVEGDLI